MLEVKYRDPDGEENIFTTPSDELANDPQGLAEEIAEDERNRSGGDLYDTSCWPRTYEVEVDGQWFEVTVEMEYYPHFSGSIKE